MKQFHAIFTSTILCVFGVPTSNAQFSFTNPTTNLCADGITSVQSFEGWEAYQTYDGTKDGERDISHCINLGEETGQATISESEIDISKPVFLHWSGMSQELLSNYLYNILMYAGSITSIDLTDITYCEDGFCQGFGIAVQVPDDPNDEDDEPETRWHFQEFGYSSMWSDYTPLCLPTEYFQDGQHITEIYLKFQFNPGFGTYAVYGLYLDYVWDTYPLSNENIQWYYTGNNTYEINWGNYLALHDATIFPNMDNITYLEIAPVPNTAEQTDVALEIGLDASLTFQPFTDMRGAFIVGSDETRHNVILTNNGGNVCMNFWAELVNEPGDQFVHNAGHLEMSWGTCMRFQPGSSLVVGPQAELHYGSQGMGMLAMQSGSNIVMQPEAKLYINNTLRLFNDWWQTDIEDVHVYLRNGNELIFGPHARVENYSTDARMKLVVHLEGGYLDLGILTDEERKHIEVVYPEQNATLALLQILSNPLSENLQFSVHSLEEAEANIQIFDTAGRLVLSDGLLLRSGYNQMNVIVNNLVKGSYIARLTSNETAVQFKFVKQ